MCLASWLGLALGCGGSSPEPRQAAGARAEPGDEEDEEQAPAPRRERRLDPSVSLDNLRGRLSPYLDSIGAGFGPGHRPSGIVSISAGGDVVYERALGHADVAADEANTNETSFRVGAITAQFTAAAVLRLVQAKKLALSDSIAKFVPDYPAVGASITVQQLLTHTSGLPNYLTKPEVAARRASTFTPHQLIELFWTDPLEFEPGSDFGYSDSDYVVLGAIIEKVSGKSYAEHMHDDIFDRFDLDDSSVGSGDDTDEVARGYTASPSGGLEPVVGLDDSILYSAAGVRSTAHDLLAWHDALQDGEVFDAKREKLSLEVVKNHYACGWFVREQRGHTVVNHPGGLDGFVSDFMRVPDLDLAIVVLLNNSSVDAQSISDAALGIALGEKIEPLPKQTSVALDASVPARIIGTYRLSDEAAKELEKRKIPKRALLSMRSVRVYQEGDKLLFKPSGQAAVPMVSTGRGSFVLVGGKAKIEVPLDPGDAPATRLLLEQGPLRVEFTRRARQRGKPEEPETSDEEAAP
ncbi:MAG TPA: serine hydrolase domain-containing protein [Polyangiaceae bacterium]|nr:serine hydrolase domain-containing protein [Polyangiaceae bacterium]